MLENLNLYSKYDTFLRLKRELDLSEKRSRKEKVRFLNKLIAN